MGDETSIYLNDKVDAGRQLAARQQAGKSASIRRAYLEYGVGDVASDDYDVADPAVWQAAHPLIGYHNWTMGRMSEEYDRALSENNLDGFRNNYLNQRLNAS